MVDKPSQFEIELAVKIPATDKTHKNQSSIEMQKFVNLKPKWNEESEAYELFFFDQAKLPSTKNFILIRDEEKDLGDKAEFFLLHGKHRSGTYNLHYREPFNDFTAFATSIISMIRKEFS